jgi:hypothetical protein
VHGADHTRRHPTSRSPSHRVPDLCDHPRSSASGLLLLPRSSLLHVMPHPPSAHHEISKHDSPNETKIKEKQNEIILDSNSNLAKSMTHNNQTKELTTWFVSRFLEHFQSNVIPSRDSAQDSVKSITTVFEGKTPESSEKSLGIEERNSRVKGQETCSCLRSAVMPSSIDFRIS